MRLTIKHGKSSASPGRQAGARWASVMLLALAGTALLPGCTRIKSSQGYVIDETLLASVKPGVDNRSSVERTLGQPTWTSEFDRSSYYYVSRNTEQLAFLQPKPTTQNVLIVSFDPRGVVTKVERDGLEHAVQVGMNKDKTPVLGKDTGILQDLFGNIGQFNGAGGTTGSEGGPGRDGPK
jgi:outer membrane protein assembly factor BamE (lipoprotein component of BamABCDE complex)